jgi:hypothetical protein
MKATLRGGTFAIEIIYFYLLHLFGFSTHYKGQRKREPQTACAARERERKIYYFFVSCIQQIITYIEDSTRRSRKRRNKEAAEKRLLFLEKERRSENESNGTDHKETGAAGNDRKASEDSATDLSVVRVRRLCCYGRLVLVPLPGRTLSEQMKNKEAKRK